MLHPTRAMAAALAVLPCAFAHAQNTSPSTLAPVTISAERDGDPSRRQAEAERSLTPGAVSVVEGEDLRLRNVGSLADMLRYTPGVWAASGMTGDSTFLSIRGSIPDDTTYDGNGVKLLDVGLPVSAADDAVYAGLEETMRSAIAAVNGFAVGYAAGLVALCDMAVMGEGAFLCDPHVRYGIAATSAASSGAVVGAKRAATLPSLAITNFSKFHRISGTGLGVMP